MKSNLRKKPTFDELINYIEVEQPKIKYPDRTATFLRNTHYLSQFDGNLFDLEEQEKQITKEQIKEKEIVRAAATTQGTASLVRSNAAQQQNRTTTAQATRRIERMPQTLGSEAQTINNAQTLGSDAVVTGNPQIFNMADDDDDDDDLAPSNITKTILANAYKKAPVITKTITQKKYCPMLIKKYQT